MVAFQAVCEPDVPENAMPGIPSLAASVAAPTVPETRTVAPRFACPVVSSRPDKELDRPTADVKARHGDVGSTPKEFRRKCLNSVAHGGHRKPISMSDAIVVSSADLAATDELT